MASVFKIYLINNKDSAGIFEILLGKRKGSEAIRPLFMKDHQYIFLDSGQSVLLHCKFIELSKQDGLSYFSYSKVAYSALLDEIKYVKADNGLFKIRSIVSIKPTANAI